MHNAKILVTGPTGQVATPVTLALARDNEVWGAARFTDAAARARLEEAGVRCVSVDLLAGDFTALPADFDYVVNLAVVRSHRWPKDMAGNGEATGLLMAHCRQAKAFFHCSSAAVYAGGPTPKTEDAPLGDNHRALLPTYSIAKISTEVVVRTMARHLGLPTIIARLNVPYGDTGGFPAYHLEMILAGQPVPVHPGGPALNALNLHHTDDIVAQLPLLLEAAAVPAVTLNWASSTIVSIQEWCTYLGELVGREPTFVETEVGTFASTQQDVSALERIVGGKSVEWHEGFRRMVAALHPELLARVD